MTARYAKLQLLLRRSAVWHALHEHPMLSNGGRCRNNRRSNNSSHQFPDTAAQAVTLPSEPPKQDQDLLYMNDSLVGLVFNYFIVHQWFSIVHLCLV
jgi:hypothetical protein